MSTHLTPYRERVTTISDLTQRQAKFVQAYMECGTQRDGAIQAALAAGYGKGERAQAKSRAYELLHDPRVLAVLRDEVAKRFAAVSSLGVSILIELAQSAHSERVRLAAAVELINRGFGPVASRNAPEDKEGMRQQSIAAFIASLPLVNDGNTEALHQASLDR